MIKTNYYLSDTQNISSIYAGDTFEKMTYTYNGNEHTIDDGEILEITKEQIRVQDKYGITDIDLCDVKNIEGAFNQGKDKRIANMNLQSRYTGVRTIEFLIDPDTNKEIKVGDIIGRVDYEITDYFEQVHHLSCENVEVLNINPYGKEMEVREVGSHKSSMNIQFGDIKEISDVTPKAETDLSFNESDLPQSDKNLQI